MNPAEEIVKFWLQQNGYFVQSSIKAGRNEIDILAVHSVNTSDRRHYEVQVSINSINLYDPPEKLAADYSLKKFESLAVTEKIREHFGGDFQYQKFHVKGEVRFKGKDIFGEYAAHCKQLGITVIPFSRILQEVSSDLGTGTQLNAVITTVQLCGKFICGQR